MASSLLKDLQKKRARAKASSEIDPTPISCLRVSNNGHIIHSENLQSSHHEEDGCRGIVATYVGGLEILQAKPGCMQTSTKVFQSRAIYPPADHKQEETYFRLRRKPLSSATSLLLNTAFKPPNGPQTAIFAVAAPGQHDKISASNISTFWVNHGKSCYALGSSGSFTYYMLRIRSTTGNQRNGEKKASCTISLPGLAKTISNTRPPSLSRIIAAPRA